MVDLHRFIPPWKTPEPPPPSEEGEIVPPISKDIPEPVQAPTKAEEPKTAPVEVPAQPTHPYRAVRGPGDPVYLIKDGTKHWILNGETFKKLGYRFGEEEKIEQSELATYPPGKPITNENWQEFK